METCQSSGKEDVERIERYRLLLGSKMLLIVIVPGHELKQIRGNCRTYLAQG
jgi:hypothetical protein